MEPREVFVYTVITGSYDEPPTFRDLDDSIACFCFTDTEREVPEPWKVQPVPSYFRDPKLTSGFLKTNPHLLFPVDSVVVWVDGNLDELSLSVEGVERMLGDQAVAVPEHRERNRVCDEAEVVERLRLEDPVRVQRLLHALHVAGFPDDLGLSATMFLVRDLSEPAMQRMNEAWWSGIAELSRRDQLTFEFSLWRSGLRRQVIDVDYREPNELFVRMPHASPRLRVLDQDEGSAGGQATAWLIADAGPPQRVSPIWYQESWSVSAAALFRRLNRVLGQSCAARASNGYGHDGGADIGERTPPDVRRSWQREFLRRSAATSRRALLLGCDGGYAAAVLLESNPVIEVSVIDSAHRLGPCTGLVELGRTHPGRVALSSETTQGGLRGLAENVDLIHLDASTASVEHVDLHELFSELDDGVLVVVRGEDSAPSTGSQVARQAGCLDPVTPGFPSDGTVRLYRWAADE